MDVREFLLRARLDAAALEAWVEVGWLAAREDGGFGELDLARAWLIRDLRDDLGVNDEGVAIVLDLVDQLHGVRTALRRLVSVLRALPEPLQEEALATLRAAEGVEGRGSPPRRGESTPTGVP
jgi:chaperone modulatory protein CbpM